MNKGKNQKISEKQKITWKNPEVRRKRLEGMKKSWKLNHDKRVESLKWKNKSNYEERKVIIKNAMNTPEMKKKRSEIAKEIWNRPGYKEKMVPLLRSYYLKNCKKMKSECGKVNRTGKSYIERLMSKILDSAKVKYYQQYPVTYKKGSGYVKFLDFYLPNHKMVIECDGERWHQDKEADEKRDKIILSVLGGGHRIEHITGKEIIEFGKFFGFI